MQKQLLPVIIVANGTIRKSCRKYLSNITRKPDIKELQKASILGTANRLPEVP